MYRLLLIKRSIEDVFIFPFILLGKMIAMLRPLTKEYRVFFFFPFYHTGGAEKVHAQIVHAIGGSESIIYFTRRSADKRFLEDFIASGCTIHDISRYTDNKWLYFLNLISRGIVSMHINRQRQKPLVFNGQSNFGYKITPWVSKPIPQIELIHSLNTFSLIRIPFLPFITRTIMISRKRIEDHISLYNKYKIPLSLSKKIQFIPNAIHLPAVKLLDRKKFNVLFVGRGSPEKRVSIFANVARKINQANSKIGFKIIGDVDSYIKPSDFPFIDFAGTVNSDSEIDSQYSQSHILMLPSSTEGFPMIIMEAMAHGLVILATPVGDIPYHIKNDKNGWLFSSVEDENSIVNEAVEKINLLNNNLPLWQTISLANQSYAKNNFGIDRFNDAYRTLFDDLKTR